MMPDILKEAYADRDRMLRNDLPQEHASKPDKQCTACKRVQPAINFSSARHGQLHSQCKSCRLAKYHQTKTMQARDAKEATKK